MNWKNGENKRRIMGGYEICPDSYEILSGFCFFHEVRKAGMLRVSQGQYKERKKTLCSTENVCYTRSLILIFSWDFSECPGLPFWRGYRMQRFPKNNNCHRVNSLILKRAISHILPQLPFYLLFCFAARPFFFLIFSCFFLITSWHWAALHDK